MTEKRWIDQGSYDKLQAELKFLTEEKRPEIVRKIDEARQDGDLKENGAYHAARDEQAMNETRIQQLEELLKNCEVGEVPEDDGVVAPGMVVKAKVGPRQMEFLLGLREANDDIALEVYSPEAPLGKALLGAKEGDTVDYATPSGKTLKVKIESVKPYQG
ncbi:transcription elongation factor GreA [Boudabousia liubingyangii]|uniref:Transcription elongation factor GreA n=1 Tax=Boudabousia liubingyangii TaxID=1921764 RepID=A0A1Q5PJU0_9ACTO|nr:transcription elongation factor GreA [Boudabousia liubingyangii]OKL46203.1 transcription elongation factor GreA [Boudabousia liubingyangii]OKL46352.1 transcription elongation factor GreA [Boudabousia liubingyangii]